MSGKSNNREMQVFISVGHNLMPQEDHFVQLVKRYLEAQGIEPIVVERQAQMISNPIETIRNIIGKAAGTIVIAIERYRITHTLEFPKTPNPQQLPPRSLATVWNQIEAAMTLQSQIPLLILREQGLTSEGIIDPAIYPGIEFTITSPMAQLPQHVAEALTDWCKWL